MNIGIYGIQFNPLKVKIFQDLFNYLSEFKQLNKVYVYQPFLELLKNNVYGVDHYEAFTDFEEVKKFDFMFCLGGDGAMLDTLCIVKDSGVPVLGINTGRLGFLSGISNNEIQNPIKAVLTGQYSIDKRNLLKLSSTSNLFSGLNFALNEVTIHKKDSSSMMIVHAYVDDEYLNSYWADGLIISTPTGSTGYNLSCSGPIIMPGSNVFVITPIAPHNLNVRPLIIPNDKTIKLKLEGRDDEFLVSLDSRSVGVNSTEELQIQKGDFQLNIVRPTDHSFLSTLRNKLTWGLDARN
jgi:NAD+ kinase